MALSAGATIKPGSSPGRLTVGGNLTLPANSVYFWELGGNTTAGPGTNWSQVTMTSGNLSVAAGAILVPAFVGTATQPNGSDPFWQSPQQWNNVIDLTGTAANPTGATALTINNAAWSAFGSFSTVPATVGGGVALLWTPVPEPTHLLLLCCGAAAGARLIRRRSAASEVRRGAHRG